MPVADFLHTLTGPIPTPFFGDPVQAQQFIDEFGQLERANRRHPLITRPDLRVELALALIYDDPTTTGWKRTVRRGRTNGWVDESVWDEFFDSFCAAWIDEAPVPQTPTPPEKASAAQRGEEPRAITIVAAVTPAPSPTLDSPTQIDGPPPRPPRSPRRPSSPRIALATPYPAPVTHTPSTTVSASSPPATIPALAAPRAKELEVDNTTDLTDTPPAPATTEDDSLQTTRFASSLPPVATTRNEEALLAPMPAPSDVPSPLTPVIAPPLTPGDEALASRIETIPTPLNILAMPRIGKRKKCVASDSGETRPCKHVVVPHRTPVTPLTDAPSPSVPYAPPPRRPRPAPGDPTRTLLISVNVNTVVEDDNASRRGVKTLDNSVLTQQTVNSPPQTLPRTHPVPRHACEIPRNPNAQANHPISRQERARSRKKPRDTSRNNLGQKHHDPDAIREARVRHALTNAERHRYRTEGRVSAHSQKPTSPHKYEKQASRQETTIPAELIPIRSTHHKIAPLASPPQVLAITCSHDSHALGSRRYSRAFPRRAETTKAEPKTTEDRDRDNIERSRGRQNTTQTASRSTPASTSPAYDAVTDYLAFCLTRKPDPPCITQPFALKLEPSAILRQWKKK
ncbi:hypothetical protein EDB86DRAFT_3084133 [Lactarius hatsudake]|nr:hypothetical protein EDB86DRAFT_3084133 [Lactarius hatsudake]